MEAYLTDAAFMGVFSDFKLIKTRSVCQLIIEVPLEQADKCLAAMGGVPLPGQERPVAVARLREKSPEQAPSPSSDGKQWKDMRPSQQAGILCSDVDFQKWIAEHKKWGPVSLRDDYSYGEDQVADLVRRKCGILSRSQMDTNPSATAAWSEIAADYHWHRTHGDQT